MFHRLHKKNNNAIDSSLDKSTTYHAISDTSIIARHFVTNFASGNALNKNAFLPKITRSLADPATKYVIISAEYGSQKLSILFASLAVFFSMMEVAGRRDATSVISPHRLNDAVNDTIIQAIATVVGYHIITALIGNHTLQPIEFLNQENTKSYAKANLSKKRYFTWKFDVSEKALPFLNAFLNYSLIETIQTTVGTLASWLTKFLANLIEPEPAQQTILQKTAVSLTESCVSTISVNQITTVINQIKSVPINTKDILSLLSTPTTVISSAVLTGATTIYTIQHGPKKTLQEVGKATNKTYNFFNELDTTCKLGLGIGILGGVVMTGLSNR